MTIGIDDSGSIVSWTSSSRESRVSLQIAYVRYCVELNPETGRCSSVNFIVGGQREGGSARRKKMLTSASTRQVEFSRSRRTRARARARLVHRTSHKRSSAQTRVSICITEARCIMEIARRCITLRARIASSRLHVRASAHVRSLPATLPSGERERNFSHSLACGRIISMACP